MKLDIKSWVIVGLVAACILFSCMWFFSGSGNRRDIKQLKKENKELQFERDSLRIVRVKLQDKVKILEDMSADKDKKIAELDTKLTILNYDLNNTKKGFYQIQKELKEALQKVNDLKRNPPNRTGDDLLESLKNKTK